MFRVVFHPSSGAHNTVSTVLDSNVAGRERVPVQPRSRQVVIQVPLMPDTVDTVL